MPSIRAAILALLITSCDGFGQPRSHAPILKARVLSPAISKHQCTIQDCNRYKRLIQSTPIKHRQSTILSAASSAAASFRDEDHNNEGQEGKTSYHPLEASTESRPPWALPWMPTWLVTLKPRTQFIIGLFLYIFHLKILTQHHITFPFQLIPNDEGWFQSIGLDSLAGMLAFGGLVWLRKASVAHVEKSQHTSSNHPSSADAVVAVPPIWKDPTEMEAPWRLQSKKKIKKQKPADAAANLQVDANEIHPRSTSIVAFALLTAGYFSTGRFSLLFENVLYAAAGFGLPLTVPMHRSLVVLFGHLAWVVVGSAILAGGLSPKPFFGGGWEKMKKQKTSNKNSNKKELRPHRWYTNKWDTYWIWWTIGGYYVSGWLFNVSDFVNQIVLPPYLFAQQAEGVVSQLINPENNDFLASLVGYIAPCISAPWWEEVLYRGYLLPALGLFMGFWPSVFVSGVLFSVHHLSVMGAIPLAVLGWLWAALYAKSGNILVTILIHGMWNSRVFLGSWLGL